MFAVLVAVLIIVSLLLRLIPGDPVDAIMSGNPGITQENMDAVREQLGLTDPMYVQVTNYSLDLLQGDMGESLRFRDLGLPTDHGEAARHHRAHGLRHDHGGADRGAVGHDHRAETRPAGRLRRFDRGRDWHFDPVFLLGILLIMAFAVEWRIFPAAGYGGSMTGSIREL